MSAALRTAAPVVGNSATVWVSMGRDLMRTGLLSCFTVVVGLACRPGPVEDPGPSAEPTPEAEVVAVLDEPARPQPRTLRDEDLGTPRVVTHGPTGVVDVYDRIVVRFSHAMQPVTTGPAAPVFELDPPIAGRVSWPSPYVVVFDPGSAMPMATKITVRATGDLVAATGESVALDATYSFETERPELTIEPLGWADEEEPRHWNTTFAVRIDDVDFRLTPARLRKHVRAVARRVDGKGKATPVAVKVRRPTTREREDIYWNADGVLVVQPRHHWPADRMVELIVDDTLPLGTVTMGRAVSETIVTAPGLGAELECAIEYGDGCDPGPLYLTFSNPVMRSQLSRIRVTPRPRNFELSLNSDPQRDDTVRINGEFEPGRSYRVQTTAGLVDVHAQPLATKIDRTFDFVEPPPDVTLRGSHGTLRATGKRTIGLETRWVERVRIRAAVLEDQQLLDQFLRDPDELRVPAGKRGVLDQTVDMPISGARGWSSREIDLAAISHDERRPVVVEVRPVQIMDEARDRPAPTTQRAIYQQSDLGAMSLLSPSRSVTRVTSLETNRPVAGVRGELYRATRTVRSPLMRSLATSGADGLVDLPGSAKLPKRGLVLLRKGDDRFVARVGEAYTNRRPSYQQRVSPYAYIDEERVLSQVVTERPIYRPGDNVYVVGWSAVATNHADVGLRPLPAGTKVELTLTDRDDEEVSRATVATKASGKYWARLKVPPSGSLGGYVVSAKIDDDTFKRRVRVKEFRTPTFSVDLSVDRGDIVAGGSVHAKLAAGYYFGGAVPIERLRRNVYCRHAYYRPPNLDADWSLGRFDRHGDVTYSVSGPTGVFPLTPADAKRGRTSMRIGSDFVPDNASYRCVLSAAVRDVSLMDVGGEASWVVHPQGYVAVQRPSGAKHAGDTIALPVRVVDFSGARKAEPVTVEVTHRQWVKAEGGWKEESSKFTTCTPTTTASGADATCKLRKLKRGRYRVRVWRTGGTEPRPVAHVQFWVGSRFVPSSSKPPQRLEMTVTPDDPSPGDKVQLRLTAAVKDANGIVAFLAGGIRRIEPFNLVDGKATLDVEVDQSWVPQMEITALLPRPETRSIWQRLETASTTVRLSEHRRDLTVEVDAPETATPNETIRVALKVSDASGNPTAANVSLWAVDEAVLSLQEPVIPDLVNAFTVRRDARTSVESEYSALLEPYTKRGDPYFPGWLSGHGTGSGFGRGYGAGGGGRGRRAPAAAAPPARERFETTPIFIGDTVLPASGEGTITGRMPENLTTFRLTAIASAALPGSKATGRFGHAEDRTRVTVPLALRVVVPRVLRPRDEAEVAAVVDNLGGPAGTIEVSLHLPGKGGAVLARGVTRHERSIAAGGQLRVPFSVAAGAAGTAEVEMRVTLTPSAAGGRTLRDAMKVELPVTTERTLIRRAAVYGTVTTDEPIAVQVAPPDDALGGSGRVELRVDASLLDGLQDVARDLVEYPYGCVEQTSSGLIPLVALGELAQQYPLGIDDIESYLSAGVARLRSMQVDGGGLGYWPGARRPHLYGTAYAVWVLERARQAGFAGGNAVRKAALSYLGAEVTRWATREASNPDADVAMAMALQALAMSDQAPEAAVDRMVELAPTLPGFARAMLVMTLNQLDPSDPRIDEHVAELAALLEHKGPGATVRAGGAIFAQYFDTSVRTSAMVLLALLEARPEHPEIEALARGLSGLRAAGRMRNTQENAYGLLALAAYARRFEAVAPRSTTDGWIGDAHAVSHRFDGDRFDSAEAARPLAALSGAKAGARVTVRREGEGRLYYRVGMQWTPAGEQERARADGIAVDTVLRSAAGRVSEDTAIEPGTLLALDVTVTVDAMLPYVAVDIPLPAGLEAVDTSIGKGRRAMVVSGTRGWWASHEEIRSDRALLFADRLRAGAHTHTVYLRATTPGSFEMPPTVAQSMYFSEIRGHTAQRSVVVGPLP